MNKYKGFKTLNRAVSKAIDVPLMDIKNIANMVMHYYPDPYYVYCLDTIFYDDDDPDAFSGIKTKIYFLVSGEEEAWELYNKYYDESAHLINSALPWSSFTRLDKDEFIDNLYIYKDKYYIAKKGKIITVDVSVQDYVGEDDEEYDEDAWFDVTVYKYKNNQDKIIPY